MECYRLPMLTGPVSLVAGETVLRKSFVKLGHDPITGHFRHDPSRCNGKGEPVTIDDGALRYGKIQEDRAVYKQIVRRRNDLRHCVGHRQPGCLQDIDAIDRFNRHRGNSDSFGFLLDRLEELFSFGRSEELRIVQPGNRSVSCKDNCRSHDRTGQWTSTGFVDTGYPGSSPAGSLILETSRRPRPSR